ncbi:hypothetical protein MKW98_008259, partial [Papaver atlanticum]
VRIFIHFPLFAFFIYIGFRLVTGKTISDLGVPLLIIISCRRIKLLCRRRKLC